MPLPIIYIPSVLLWRRLMRCREWRYSFDLPVEGSSGHFTSVDSPRRRMGPMNEAKLEAGSWERGEAR